MQLLGQQNLPPWPSPTQNPVANSPATVQACPFASLGRQLPLKHHWPAPHASPLGQLPQLVAVLQYPVTTSGILR